MVETRHDSCPQTGREHAAEGCTRPIHPINSLGEKLDLLHPWTACLALALRLLFGVHNGRKQDSEATELWRLKTSAHALGRQTSGKTPFSETFQFPLLSPSHKERNDSRIRTTCRKLKLDAMRKREGVSSDKLLPRGKWSPIRKMRFGYREISLDIFLASHAESVWHLRGQNILVTVQTCT